MDTTQQQGQPNVPPSGNKSGLKEIEDFLELYLHTNVPFHLPLAVKEFIVKFGPWIDLVLLVIAAPIVLAALGLSIVFLPFGAITHPFATVFGTIHWIIMLAAFVLQAAALPGLFRRSLHTGWYYIFYATLIGSLGQLLYGNIIGFVVGTAISLYFLFQVKQLYK